MRTSRTPELISWIKELRSVAKSTQAGALHYERINRLRRSAVCAALSAKPIRTFTVASHKTNMREYVNPRIGTMIESGTFYNWCLRLLLERVTSWTEQWFKNENINSTPLEVVFARRGHDYEHFFKYVDLLRMQKANGTLFKKGPGLSEPFLDRSYWRLEKASELAGLQLADIVASSFYQAANTASPLWDPEPAKALKPIVATKKGSEADFGLTVWPLPHQATVPEKARDIFRYYGYGW